MAPEPEGRFSLNRPFDRAIDVQVSRLRKLPVGRAWEALREDEIACRALGINVTTTKLSAFALGAMFGGFAGAFFATRQAFISPESFTFIESAIILAIVVLGGLGSQIGVAIAALVMLSACSKTHPPAEAATAANPAAAATPSVATTPVEPLSPPPPPQAVTASATAPSVNDKYMRAPRSAGRRATSAAARTWRR